MLFWRNVRYFKKSTYCQQNLRTMRKWRKRKTSRDKDELSSHNPPAPFAKSWSAENQRNWSSTCSTTLLLLLMVILISSGTLHVVYAATTRMSYRCYCLNNECTGGFQLFFFRVFSFSSFLYIVQFWMNTCFFAWWGDSPCPLTKAFIDFSESLLSKCLRATFTSLYWNSNSRHGVRRI